MSLKISTKSKLLVSTALLLSASLVPDAHAVNSTTDLTYTTNSSTAVVMQGGSGATTFAVVDTGSGAVLTAATPVTINGANSTNIVNVAVGAPIGADLTGITATGGTEAIVVTGAGVPGTITNGGNITSSASGATIDLGTSSHGAYTANIDNNNANSVISNTGTGAAISIATADTVNITNVGTITGAVTSAGTGAITVASNSGNMGALTGGGTGAITVTTNSGTLGAISGGGNVSVTSTAGSIGAISNGGSGTLSLTESGGTVASVTASGTGLATIALTNAASVTGNVNISAANASSTISLGNTSSIGGNVVMGNASQSLTLNTTNGAGVAGTINGLGDIIVNQNETLAGSVGDTTAVDNIAIASGMGLTTAGSATTFKAATVTLASGSSSLTIDTTGTLAGTINGATGADQGILNLNANNTLTGNVGNLNSLHQINIASDVVIAGGNNIIKATALDLDSGSSLTTGSGLLTAAASLDTGSTLTLGSGGYTGTIDGVSGGDTGALVFATTTTAANGNVGSDQSLASITVNSGVSVSGGSNMYRAFTIDVNGNGTLDTGVTGGLNATNGAITVGSGALTIGSGGYSGTINNNTGTAGAGNVVFSGSQTTGGDIGTATNGALASVTVNDTVTVATANNIKATTVTVGGGTSGILNQSAGTITATTVAVGADGTYNQTGTGAVVGNVTVGAGGSFSLDGTGVTGTIGGASQGVGNVTFAKSYTTTGAVGTAGSSDLNQVFVSAGDTLTLGANLAAIDTHLLGAGAGLNLGGANRTVTGDIDASSGGAANIALGANTLTLAAGTGSNTGTGTFITGSGDVIATTINATTAGAITTVGHIVAPVSSTNAGTDVAITLTPAAGYIANGASFKLVDGSAGTAAALTNDATQISVNGGTNQTELLTFTSSSVDSGHDLQINVARIAMATIAANTQNASIGAAMDAIGAAGTATGELALSQTALNNATTAGQVNTILESLTPEEDNSILMTTVSDADLAMNTFEARLGELRSGKSGVSSGDAEPGSNVWIKAFGSKGSEDDISGVPGFDSTTAGAALGADRAVNDDVRVGVGFAYADTTIDSNDDNKSTDSKAYQVFLYGDDELAGNNYIDGLAGFGWDTYDTSRFIPTAASTASGSFDGQTYMARISAGHRIDAGNGFEIVPNAGITYALTQTDSYTETGAGTADLNVKTDDINVLRPKVGVDVAFNGDAGGVKIRPSVRVGYVYDAMDTNQTSTSSFSSVPGTTFRTDSADTSRSMLVAGAGLDLATVGNVTLSADYDYEYKSDYSSHNGMLNLKYGF